MRQAARWLFHSVVVTGILGLLLFFVFLVLASRDPNRMTGAEFAVGILMVLLWLYFWAALVVGIIISRMGRETNK